MTPDSERYRSQLLEIAQRFASAVRHSFNFLGDRGFTECAPVTTDLEDLRDAMTTHRYICDSRAINIALSLLTRQMSVVIFDYDSSATCDTKQKFHSRN